MDHLELAFAFVTSELHRVLSFGGRDGTRAWHLRC